MDSSSENTYLSRIEDLEKKVSRLEAKDEIRNLMSRFAFLQSSARYKEIMDDLFSKRKDRSYEEGYSGVYTDDKFSPDLILSYFKNRYGCYEDEASREKLKGNLVTNAFSSPFIEVSEDCMSARGYWITIGQETIVLSDGERSGVPSIDEMQPDENGKRHRVYWIWQKYDVEFIREDGSWRILHMHAYEAARGTYHKDWVEYSRERYADDQMQDSEIRFGESPTHASYPTTYHQQYSTEEIPSQIPLPPTDDGKAE
ncbi:MAG: nuclear transport factor 2 family protein [Oscillospiraceae bacterium]